MLTLVGAAQFRAGRVPDAIATLEKAVRAYGPVESGTPDQDRALRLFAETFLLMAYRDGRHEVRAGQAESLGRLIERELATPPQYQEDSILWAIPLALHFAQHEHSRAESPPTAANGKVKP
jgi:hypothetical protein